MCPPPAPPQTAQPPLPGFPEKPLTELTGYAKRIFDLVASGSISNDPTGYLKIVDSTSGMCISLICSPEPMQPPMHLTISEKIQYAGQSYIINAVFRWEIDQKTNTKNLCLSNFLCTQEKLESDRSPKDRHSPSRVKTLPRSLRTQEDGTLFWTFECQQSERDDFKTVLSHMQKISQEIEDGLRAVHEKGEDNIFKRALLIAIRMQEESDHYVSSRQASFSDYLSTFNPKKEE